MTDPILVWSAVGTISAFVIGALSVMLAIMSRRDKRSQERNNEIKEEIKTAVDHLGEVLTARMETKDTVSRISERLARVEGAMGIVNDRQSGSSG